MNANVSPSAHQIPAHIASERVFEFDIYHDPRFTEDLHDSYAQVLRQAPDIFWTPLNGGHWCVSRYADIVEVVKDYENFSAREMQIPRVPNPPTYIPLSLDPPASVPYRQALMPFFSPKAAVELEPRMRKLAIRIIEEVVEKGECDFIHDVAARFPVGVFMELMGMPLDKLHEFRALADSFFNARTQDEFTLYGGQIIGIMTELIERKRIEPQDDLLSRMIGFRIEGRPITLGEMQSACFVMFLGGMDTVTNVTGFSFRRLGRDKALQARLRSDPSSIPKFVEEGIRSFAVVCTPRIVARDCERFGVTFKEGEMVLCMLPVGSRDDRMHESPDAFDIDRKAMQHITFSTGPHLCLGHNLARMEMKILTEEWVKRIPAFTLRPGIRHTSRCGTVISLETLPIAWSA
jgi:cytochrome P450